MNGRSSVSRRPRHPAHLVTRRLERDDADRDPAEKIGPEPKRIPGDGMPTVFGRLTGKRNASGNYAANNASTSDLTLVDSNSSALTLRPGTSGSISKSAVERTKVQESNTRPHRRESSILSLKPGGLAEVGSNVRRSVSLRSHRTTLSSGSSFGNKNRSLSGGHVLTPLSSPDPIESPAEATSLSPQKRREGPHGAVVGEGQQPSQLKRKISLTARGLSRKFTSTEQLPSLHGPAYLDGLAAARARAAADNDPATFNSMLAQTPTNIPSRPPGLRPQGSFSRDISSLHGGPNGAPLSHAPTVTSIGGPLNANTIYTQIHETSAKRMATIDYIRRLHDGDIFYFSTLHYSPASLSAMPSLSPHKLARRATNYFLLGYSLPTLLDMNCGNPLEYLKALSSLLSEFETYQTLSGFDTSGNTVSKGRVGQMFKSGIGLGNRSTKGRRSSTTVDSGSLDPRQADLLGMPISGRGATEAGSPQDMSSPIHPTGHEFSYLLTPHLPFDPDFSTTLSTLCDTLIDTYAKLTDLVSGPDACSPSVGSEFAKADKAIRKILVANVVREFEDTTRAAVKGEMAGLGKLVLGGLM